MSLLKPTPGSILDRISILRLKIEAYLKAGRDVGKLNSEMDKLPVFLSKYSKSPDLDCGEIRRLFSLLGAVNKELWACEDKVRSLVKSNDDRGCWALEAHRLNDVRIGLIRQLDKAFGCTDSVEEKIYR